MKVNKRLEAGDRILVLPCLFYPFNGRITRDFASVRLIKEELGLIKEVILDKGRYHGRHLIVELSVGTIDIWTSQDQFLYRRP